MESATKDRERLACVIAGRNLGDIVMASTAVKRLAATSYADRYIVWTRPQAAVMFENIPGCEVVCSPFPVGTNKQFGWRGALQFLKAVRQIRSLKPVVSLDFVGDLRERMFAALIGHVKTHVHIGWEKGHPYAQLIRNPLGQGHPFVTVPATVPNVYAAQDLMLSKLAPGAPVHEPDPVPSSARGGSLRIGLHPFASQACKQWPGANWASLVDVLLDRGYTLCGFSAPAELPELRKIFASQSGRIEFIAGNLRQFSGAVAQLDLMIGLDSFSVHMAERLGIASIMINAGAPAELWEAPGGETLWNSGGCRYYPCYNRAPCTGTAYENACVNSISVQQIIAAIDARHRH